jgi:(R,R)-butanediol dehydrogenase/meso-butanediol dehydrogenase/diacetyl reductase
MAGCGYCPACLSGDPIACTQCRYIMGGFGEYTIADADYAVRLPASLSLSDGALVEPLACGAQAARLAGVNAASRVLVIGVGAIGLGAIYWAHRAGCEQIVASGTSDRADTDDQHARRSVDAGETRRLGAACQGPWRSSWAALPTSSSNAAGRGA